jgi:hypothetical protein
MIAPSTVPETFDREPRFGQSALIITSSADGFELDSRD